MSEELRWIYSTMVAFGVVFFLTLMINLVRADILIRWDKEKKPNIVAKPHGGRRLHRGEHENLLWAELRVTNSSSTEPLGAVEVCITDCILVSERHDNPNEYVFVRLSDWNPARVYWSIRDINPHQLSATLAPGETKTALIAFQDNPNGGSAFFNTATKPSIAQGAKIEIEISSVGSGLWRGEFYIHCHPNHLDGPRATFEFTQFGDWAKTHPIWP